MKLTQMPKSVKCFQEFTPSTFHSNEAVGTELQSKLWSTG